MTLHVAVNLRLDGAVIAEEIERYVAGADPARGTDDTVISLWSRPTTVSKWYLKDTWMSRWFGWPWRWWYAEKVSSGE